MRTLKHSLLCLGLFLSLCLGLALSSTSAFADSVTGTATLTGGSLTEASSAAPSVSATLNGTDLTRTYTLPITDTDSTGTGNGWNMTITSTQFTTGGGSPNTLPTGASTITGVTSSCATGTCIAPTNAITYSMALPAGATAPTAVKVFNAAANTGMGQFTITPTVSVAIPASSYAGTYTSTITLAIVSGP